MGRTPTRTRQQHRPADLRARWSLQEDPARRTTTPALRGHAAMSPTESAWRAALARWLQAIKEDDPHISRHRENELAAWKSYRTEMAERAKQLKEEEAR